MRKRHCIWFHKQGNRNCLTAVHAEYPLLILRRIKFGRLLITRCIFFGHIDVQHSVHAIISGAFMLIVPGNQVIAVIHIHQMQWRFLIETSIALQGSFLPIVVFGGRSKKEPSR